MRYLILAMACLDLRGIAPQCGRRVCPFMGTTCQTSTMKPFRRIVQSAARCGKMRQDTARREGRLPLSLSLYLVVHCRSEMGIAHIRVSCVCVLLGFVLFHRQGRNAHDSPVPSALAWYFIAMQTRMMPVAGENTWKLPCVASRLRVFLCWYMKDMGADKFRINHLGQPLEHSIYHML